MATNIKLIGGDQIEVDLSPEDTLKALAFPDLTAPGWAKVESGNGDVFVRIEAVAYIKAKKDRSGQAHFS